jgi:hypothetical protein
MTPILYVAICVAAVAAICSGQATFVPKSNCGVAALKCYTDQQTAMDTKLATIDFAGGCQIYKLILICMTGAGDCESDADFNVVRDQLNADQDGICGVDGTINSCGFDVQTCFQEMDSAVADALIKNFTNACPLVVKFVKCAKRVVSTSNECPKSLTDKITTMEQNLGGDQDAFGCDGPCPQAVADCTTGAELKPGNISLLNANITKYCSSASKVYYCLNNLTTAAICATSSSGYLRDIALNAVAAVGDMCNPDGSVSDCVKDVVECAVDLASVKKGVDIATQCAASSEFLECISRLPCSTSLSSSIVKLRDKFETIEIELTCPSVGSCNDRWSNCASADVGLLNMTVQNVPKVCKAAKTAHQCFDYVRSDPLCINEKNFFTTSEQEINLIQKLHCAATWLTPMPLFAVTLLAILRQFL